MVHSLMGLFEFVLAALFGLLALQRWWNRRSAIPLPPGPKGIPFAGNILQMPHQDTAEVFLEWSKVYGDIFYLHVFGRSFIILNSATAALDLFDNRGAIYSDRPHLVMAGDLVGRRDSVLFHAYGERLKKHRKLLRNVLNSRRIMDYWPLLEAESLKLMKNLLDHPKGFIAHLRRNAGAVTLQLAYGYQVALPPHDDYYIKLAEELARITTESSEPGRWLVDSFPWLQHVPAWLPGAGFKTWAKEARQKSDEFTEAPYSFAKTSARVEHGFPSFVTESLELLQEENGGKGVVDPSSEQLLKWTAASIYAGGTDTTVALVTSFFLYMARYPRVQAKAQAELDAVVGYGRLPNMQDQSRLPYIDCLIREIHRFHPIVPLIPHSTLRDDIYRGYHIPSGCWIMANSSAIMHDPTEFPDPEEFSPERYTDGRTSVDPRDYSFGFGRRRCPGIELANVSIFLTVVHTLAIFTIAPPADEYGEPVEPPLAFTTGHVSHPKPFTCIIKPRSNDLRDLLASICADQYAA